jgi:hypothetical protein
MSRRVEIGLGSTDSWPWPNTDPAVPLLGLVIRSLQGHAVASIRIAVAAPPRASRVRDVDHPH